MAGGRERERARACERESVRARESERARDGERKRDNERERTRAHTCVPNPTRVSIICVYAVHVRG